MRELLLRKLTHHINYECTFLFIFQNFCNIYNWKLFFIAKKIANLGILKTLLIKLINYISSHSWYIIYSEKVWSNTCNVKKIVHWSLATYTAACTSVWRWWSCQSVQGFCKSSFLKGPSGTYYLGSQSGQIIRHQKKWHSRVFLFFRKGKSTAEREKFSHSTYALL